VRSRVAAAATRGERSNTRPFARLQGARGFRYAGKSGYGRAGPVRPAPGP